MHAIIFNYSNKLTQLKYKVVALLRELTIFKILLKINILIGYKILNNKRETKYNGFWLYNAFFNFFILNLIM